MQIIKKIKRFSSEYRKHEKEISEIELQKISEIFKGILGLYQTAIQLAVISNTPKTSGLSVGGILPDKKPAGDVVIINQSKVNEIFETIREKDGKINIQVKTNAKS